MLFSLCSDKDDKQLSKALSELTAAKVEIAELKAQVAQLSAQVELKDELMKHEAIAKEAHIELATSRAKLEAQRDLATQVSDAYNNGLKFAQSAFAMFAPAPAARGPPSSGHRSSSSRMSHSSAEEY